MSIAFGLFTIGILAIQITLFNQNVKASLAIYEFNIIALFVSTILLAGVLYKLIIDQAASEDYDAFDDQAEINVDGRDSLNSFISEEPKASVKE